MKKILKVVTVILAIVILLTCINSILYPIALNIDESEIEYAEIIYFGDNYEQKVENPNDINRLIGALNKLRFKEREDMSHMAPHSGVMIVDLYNKDGKCIDSIQFYDWVYRGGEYKGEERKHGSYLSAKKGFALRNTYIVCDELAGDPFGRKEYKWIYWLLG